MQKFKSKTHDRRLSLRLVSHKAWPDYSSAQRAFANTEGDRGDSNRGQYYEAVTAAPAPGRRGVPVNVVYACTRVFTRERQLSIIIGGSALEAAQTTVWLGTNKKP
jgi:hypothetical protein